MPSFPNTDVKSVLRWSNYAGTIDHRAIELFCTPRSLSTVGTTDGVLRPHGDAIRGILEHCFDPKGLEHVRTLGSRLSFSRIIEPGRVVIDPPNMNVIWRVSEDSLTDAYRGARGARGFVPVIVESGTTVNSMNRRLAEIGLALQTSGAGDGHRIAGCIATGTHGSAMRVGAVHDTVRGIHLVVAPNRAVFVQSRSEPCCKASFAEWLTKHTGIPTQNIEDDEMFHAALVGLGSFGFVFSLIVEAEPLYRLERKTVVCSWDDVKLWTAMLSLDTSSLHPERPQDPPHHFDVLFHPYKRGGDGAYATLMWKTAVGQAPLTFAPPLAPDTSSDHMGFISHLTQALDGPLTAPLTSAVLGEIIASQLARRFAKSSGTIAFPGEIFGPTSLPPGMGASTEIVVDHSLTQDALETLFDVIEEHGARGKHLLGAFAVRFVPGTKALLGMNIHTMNTFIELPSIRTQDVLDVYTACWDALEEAGIPFTCHWGQLHALDAVRVATYFGGREQRWRKKREELLDADARKVFAAPILEEIGLS
jgi:hypothetical protein